MHKTAVEVEKNIGIPLVHIADETGLIIVKRNLKKVGFLGTKVTMQEDFFKKRFHF